MSEYDVLQPDVVFFGRDKIPQLNPLTGAHVVPDVAVEVLSRSTEARDRGRKMTLLARYGLPEYWLVDPVAEVLEIFTLTAGELLPAGVSAGSEQVDGTLLPGLKFPLDRLFGR